MITEAGGQAGEIGQMLRQARVANGLSIAEVSERLNLSARQIMALEAEDFANLPQPTYVRGYLRSYAALVGLSPPAVVSTYDRQIQPKDVLPILQPEVQEPPVIEFEKRETRSGSGSGARNATAMVVLVLVVGGGYWLWREVSRERVALEPPAVSGPVGIAGAGKRAVPVPDFTASVNLPPNVPAPVMSVVPPAAVSAPPRPPAAPAKMAPSTAPAPVFPGQQAYGQLVVVPGQDSMVRVQDQAGNTLLQERVPAGQPLSLDGLSPFTITLSDPRGASVQYNGRAVAVPAPTGSPVRLVVGGSAR